jgi:uncharacterized membrane-anchored protein
MRWSLAVALALFAGGVGAQEAAGTDEALAEAGEAQEAPAQQLAFKRGEVVLPGGQARLEVPESFGYLDPAQTEQVLVSWGNPPGSETLGMLLPSGLSPDDDASYGVIITYADDGHVDDEDAKETDYAELLEEMQASTDAENAAREEAGYAPVKLVGWATAPHYDSEAKKIYWAKELKFGAAQANTLNYSVRVLGKEGVLELNAVSAMGQLKQVEQGMQQVLAFTDFQPGHRYADFDPATGRLAGYGVAGLVAGKVAAKAGFFKVALAALLGAKKLVGVAVVGLIALLSKLFKGGKQEG